MVTSRTTDEEDRFRQWYCFHACRPHYRLCTVPSIISRVYGNANTHRKTRLGQSASALTVKPPSRARLPSVTAGSWVVVEARRNASTSTSTFTRKIGIKPYYDGECTAHIRCERHSSPETAAKSARYFAQKYDLALPNILDWVDEGYLPGLDMLHLLFRVFLPVILKCVNPLRKRLQSLFGAVDFASTFTMYYNYSHCTRRRG